MEKKIAKIGIIMILTLALIFSSFGALLFRETLANEFDVGLENDKITAQAVTTAWEYPTKDTISAKPFANGSGTVESPFQISTAQELANLSYLVNNNTWYDTTWGSKAYSTVCYILTVNIALNDTTSWQDWGTTAPTHSWTPIGIDNDNNPFKGTFDGNGHTVSGIYIKSTTILSCGLFGEISSDATVKKVGVINSYIKCETGGSTDYGNIGVGGVVGLNYGGSIINCYNSGAVSGTVYNIGGVVGMNSKNTSNSRVGTVTNCYNTGSVSGTVYNVGGVVGQNNDGAVINSYNTGNVSGTNNGGGVVGYNSGSVINCYNTGAVSRNTDAGGVVGKNSGGTVTNCYFLKITNGTNSTLNPVGFGAWTNCASFIDTNGELNPKTLVGAATYAYLLPALNFGGEQYNYNNSNAIQAEPWFDVPNDYPNFTPIVTSSGSSIIYANGRAITLKEGTTPGYTNIYYDEAPNTPINLAKKAPNGNILPKGSVDTGYKLSGYSIYGGGGAAITGNTSVTMESGEVKYIYGGGSNAPVNGNTSVTIRGGTVKKGEEDYFGGGDVYGGGLKATVNGSTTITISQDVGKTTTITGNVYGGGNGVDADATVTGTKTVKISGGTITGNVFGGDVGNKSTVNVSGAPTIGKAAGASPDTLATGIIINNSGTDSTATKVSNGVDKFVINGNLSAAAKINVVLPSGYGLGTVATKTSGITAVESNFTLVGKSADIKDKKLQINGTELKVVPKLINIDIEKTAKLTMTYDGTGKAYAVSGTNHDLTFVIAYRVHTESVDTAYDLATAPINAGTYDVKITRAADATYAAFEATIASGLTINKANLPTITYPTAAGVTYGATLSTSELTGGSVGYGAFAWTYGTPIPTVENSGYSVTFTPSDSTKQNYNCNASYTEIVKITVKPAKITTTAFGAYTGVYDGIAHSITAGTPTTVNSQTATIEYSTDNTTWLPTNPTRTDVITTTVHYKITAPNHDVLTNFSTITITAKQIAVAWDNSTYTYNGKAQTPTITNSNLLVGGDKFTITLSAKVDSALTGTSAINAGSYTGTATASKNYKLTTNTKDFTIAQKEVALAWSAPANLEYDGNAKVPTVKVSNLVNSDNCAVTASLTSGSNANAGTFTYTATGLDNANYVLSGTLTKDFIITARPITITADAISKVYGTADPELTYSIASDALVGSDKLTGKLSRVAGEDVGTYAINSTLANSNYTITFTGESLTITKANLTVTASSHTVAYGDPIPAYTVAYSGFVNMETASVLTKQPTASSLYATTTPVGSIATTASGGEDENYEFSYVPGSVTIGKATPTISGIPTAELNKEYGTPLSGISLTGGTASTAGTFTWASGATIPSVGNTEYEVTFTPTDTTNYTTVTCKVTPKIEKKPLTVTANAHAITYGDAPINNDVTYNGFIAGENASKLTGALQYSYDYTQYGDFGSYQITPSGLTSANYAISFVNGNLTVNQMNITATITPNGKVYDGTTTATIKTIDFSKVVNNDVLSLAGGTLTFSDKVAGTSKTVTAVGYTLAGDKNANYKLTSVTANSADIEKKALTVAGTDAIIEKNYDGTTDVKTPLKKGDNYTITGAINADESAVDITPTASYSEAVVADKVDVNVTFELNTETAKNYFVTDKTMTLNGKIIGISAELGVDYTVEKKGDATYIPFDNGTTKYFNDSYVIKLVGTSEYKTISDLETFGNATTLEVKEACDEHTFYVKKENGQIGKVILKYGIDKTAPTIAEAFTINEKASDVWFKNDTATIKIGSIDDERSQICWTDDGNFPMTLAKGGQSVDFSKDEANKTVTIPLVYSSENPINGDYVLTIYDNVGNKTEKTLTVNTHDNVAPTIDLSAIDFTTWQGATTIAPVVKDNTVVDGVAQSDIAETKINGVVQNRVTFDKNGRHELVVETKDKAGNATKTEKKLFLCDINIDLFNAKFSGNKPKDTRNASDARAIFNKLSNEAKLHISGNVASNIVASANYAGLLKYEEEQKEAIKAIQIATLKTAIDNAAATMTKDAVASMKVANISVDVFVGVGKEYQDKYNNVLAAMSVNNKLNSIIDNNSQLVDWVATYDKLNEKVKPLVDVIISADVVTTNKDNLAVVNAIKDKVDAIKMPVTSQNYGDVKTIVGEYDKLNADIKKLISVSTTEKLEKLRKIIDKTNETQAIIDAIPDVVPSPLTNEYVESVMKAKTAVDSLDSNGKSLVNTEKLDKGLAEIAKDETIKKNNDLASEIAKAIMKSNDSMIADKILECWKTYDMAENAIKTLVDKMLPNSFVTLKANAEVAKTDVEAIKAIDLTKIVSVQATREEAKNVVAAINSQNAQTQKIVKNECGELLNEMIKLIDAYEAITKLPSTDNKVDDCELCNGSESGGETHDTAAHLKQIEEAKKAFEKLNDKEKEKLGKELCDKINAQYIAMLNYVEQLKQSLKVNDTDKDISVYGIVTGVDQSVIPDVETAEEIHIKVKVEKTDSKIDEFTKSKIVSYDISLLGKTANATEYTKLQPKANETVTIRMPIGNNFIVDTLEIYHVLNNGRRKRIEKFTLSNINGQLYAIFDVSSFSEFFAYGETKNSPTAPDITIPGGAILDRSVENEIRFKDTNPVLVDVSNRENTLSKSILDAINDAESGKVITVIFKEGEIAITKEQLKGVVIDKKSYTYAELKVLIEKPEIIPTPTPTPTEKPTEPVVPEKPTANLTWLWILLAVIVVATITSIVIIKTKNK